MPIGSSLNLRNLDRSKGSPWAPMAGHEIVGNSDRQKFQSEPDRTCVVTLYNFFILFFYFFFFLFLFFIFYFYFLVHE